MRTAPRPDLPARKEETLSFYTGAVQRAIEHAVCHLDSALDLHRLASGVGLSPFHFHRIFRGMTGETPLELVRRLRMERAAWRLKHTRRSITEIAFDAGYETHEAFTRAFRLLFGISPSGFRRGPYARTQITATSGVHFDASFDERPGAPCSLPPFTPRDSGGRNMDVEIRQMPERRVGAVRHIGPYNQIPEAFGRLGEIATRAGLAKQPGIEVAALYHDDPESTPQDQLRSDAAFFLPEDLAVPEELVEYRLPAGRYACTVHKGSYAKLGDTWARFMGEWLPHSGHCMANTPSFELYPNDPRETPEQELITVICIPLAE